MITFEYLFRSLRVNLGVRNSVNYILNSNDLTIILYNNFKPVKTLFSLRYSIAGHYIDLVKKNYDN